MCENARLARSSKLQEALWLELEVNHSLPYAVSFTHELFVSFVCCCLKAVIEGCDPPHLLMASTSISLRQLLDGHGLRRRSP